jgi:sulfofructose kinase
MVDHFGTAGMTRAAKIARSAHLPVIADFERSEGPDFRELLGLPDHLVLSQSFACKLTGMADPSEIAAKLWNQDRAIVVITGGADGSWYRSREDGPEVQHQPAFPVHAIDTTGCGDVFRGAYVSALIRQVATPQRVRFASAAAALKATRFGPQAGIPTREAVEALLTQQQG